MTPYVLEYCEDKIREYKKYIKKREIGEYKIIYGRKSKFQKGYMYENEEGSNEGSIILKYKNKLVMEISPKEIQGTYEAIKNANGKVGVLGLGLGYYVQEISKKDTVNEIIVYEQSKELIDLYLSNFGENKKVKFILGDGFKAKGEKFDFFFVDIYGYKITKSVVDDYKKLNEIHEIYDYSFFGVEYLMLSSTMEKIMYIYIPDIWLDFSKDLFDKFNRSGKINYFKKLDDKLVDNIFNEFEKVLNA